MTVNYEIGKPRADKRMRVTFILCVGNSKKRIKSDYFVTQSDLNRKGKIKNDAPTSSKIRARIRQIEDEYTSLDTFLTGEGITASEAVAKIKQKDIPTFFMYSEKWLDRATMKGKKNYMTAIKRFREFTKNDISFNMFNRMLINDFIYSLKDKPRAQSLYVNAIKKIYTEAEKDYNIKPFASFKVDIPKQNKTKSIALDKKTLTKIFQWDGTNKRAIMARDCAILSFCLCGTNSTDLYYAPTIKGNTLMYDRQKTKDRRADNAHIEIKIPKQIKNLIAKYKGTSRAFRFHLIYTNESNFNKHINIGLKTIGKELGIKNLTFYAFRHSWATIARNDLGIDRWTVHEGLNHRDDDTAIDDIYIKKDFRLINEANKKVVDYVFTDLTNL